MPRIITIEDDDYADVSNAWGLVGGTVFPWDDEMWFRHTDNEAVNFIELEKEPDSVIGKPYPGWYKFHHPDDSVWRYQET